MIQKGSWVCIKKVLLQPGQRTGRVPEETAAVPFTSWVKGRLTADGEIGAQCTVVTRTGRSESGELVQENPNYTLDYGDYVPELLEIGDAARAILKGGAAHA